MKKKILHMIGRTQGGGGRTTALEFFPAYRQEFQTSAVVEEAGDLADQLRGMDISTHTLSMENPRTSPLMILPLAGILRREKPDLLILYGQVAGFNGVLAARLAGLRKIIYLTCFPSFYTDWDLARVARNRVVEAVTCRMSSRIVCFSQSNRYQYLLRNLATDRQVQCIPYPIDVEKIQPTTDRQSVRAALNLNVDGPLVVSLGRLVDQKRFDWLVAAWQRVEGVHPTATLLVVGDGKDRGKLEAQARSLGLKRARFLGYRKEDGFRFFQAADLGVITSMFEAPGLVALEAMAAGCPLVVTAADGVRDAVIPGVTGELTAVGDPDALAAGILKLLGDEPLRREMGMAARRFVQAHNAFPVVLQQHFALARELLQPGS